MVFWKKVSHTVQNQLDFNILVCLRKFGPPCNDVILQAFEFCDSQNMHLRGRESVNYPMMVGHYIAGTDTNYRIGSMQRFKKDSPLLKSVASHWSPKVFAIKG